MLFNLSAAFDQTLEFLPLLSSITPILPVLFFWQNLFLWLFLFLSLNSKVFLGTFYFAQFSLLAVFLDVKVSMHLYVGNSQVCKYSFLNFLLLSPFPTLLFHPASDPRRPPNVLSSTLAPRRSSPFLLRYSYYGGHCLDSRVP